MVTNPTDPKWNAEQVREFLQRQIDDMRTMLDERYATQTKAVDAAFVAQQTAMSTALTAQALAVQVAQAAAKEATAKAEEAADKRFDALVEKMDEEALRVTAQISAIRSSLDLGQGKYLAVAGLASVLTGSIVAAVMRVFA